MRNRLGALIEKIDEVGLLFTMKGAIKRMYFSLLMQQFHFNKWHTPPIEYRKYALDTVKIISDGLDNDSTVVEIGCGLGEILRRIDVVCKGKKVNLSGFDISPEVIDAARALDAKHHIKYSVGSFDSVREMDIDYLITVNFIHNIKTDDLVAYYRTLSERNNIRNIVADTVSADGYAYHHDLNNIVPDRYVLTYKSDLYKPGRCVMIFSRQL